MNFSVISPTTHSELISAIQKNRQFRFGAGYTDLIPELNKNSEATDVIINLSNLNDKIFTSITREKRFLRIGAMVTADQISENFFILKNFPVLHQAANTLASQQIRHVATIGGNICTASPSGDLACALVALKSEAEIINVNNKHIKIPINEFFKGPKQSVLKKQEILRSVIIPLNEKNYKQHSGFIKVGTRRSMECSVVSLAYHIQYDKNGLIQKSGVAIGAVAPTIKKTAKAEEFLINKNIFSFSDMHKEEFAQLILSYSSPISDVRASAWYRKEVLYNISKGVFRL